MEKKEQKMHVVYYTPGKNMQGLHKLMGNLQKLWGSNVIALPKDVIKLAQNEMSIEDLINLRTMINKIIANKMKEKNQGNRPSSENNTDGN